MILLYVDEPGEVTQQAVAFARTLGGPINALSARDEVAVEGIDTLHVAEHEALSSYAPAATARALVDLAERITPTAVVAAGTHRGNEVLAHASRAWDRQR